MGTLHVRTAMLCTRKGVCIQFDKKLFSGFTFRRKLNVCPILEGEDSVRLLNFQHNFIIEVENLSQLKRLIFLDFYDNQLEYISGLSALKSLRVLMLGKNR